MHKNNDKIENIPRFLEDFSKRLRNLREDKGLSRIEFSEKLGLSGPSQISRYENGVNSPGLEQLVRMAMVLDVDLHWLITGQLAPSTVKIHNALKPYLMAHLNDVFAKLQKLEEQRQELIVLEQTPEVESRMQQIQDESYKQQLYFKTVWDKVNETLKEYGLEVSVGVNFTLKEKE